MWVIKFNIKLIYLIYLYIYRFVLGNIWNLMDVISVVKLIFVVKIVSYFYGNKRLIK